MYTKYSTLPLWWWIVMLFAIISIVSHFSLTDWGSMSAIVAAIVAVGVLFWAIGRAIVRKCQLHRLFEAYYEQTPDDIKKSLTLNASPNEQDVKITLRLIAPITLQFIVISFEGAGKKPEIKKGFDHQINQYHLGVYYYPLNDGALNLTFTEVQRRTAKQHIRIGLKTIASVPFGGYLKVHLKTEEGAKKTIPLPLQVE